MSDPRIPKKDEKKSTSQEKQSPGFSSQQMLVSFRQQATKATPVIFNQINILRLLCEYCADLQVPLIADKSKIIVSRENQFLVTAAASMIVKSIHFPQELFTKELGLHRKDFEIFDKPDDLYLNAALYSQAQKLSDFILENNGINLNATIQPVDTYLTTAFENINEDDGWPAEIVTQMQTVIKPNAVYVMVDPHHSYIIAVIDDKKILKLEANEFSLMPEQRTYDNDLNNFTLALVQDYKNVMKGSNGYATLFEITQIQPTDILTAHNEILKEMQEGKQIWGREASDEHVASNRNCHAYVYQIMHRVKTMTQAQVAESDTENETSMNRPRKM